MNMRKGIIELAIEKHLHAHLEVKINIGGDYKNYKTRGQLTCFSQKKKLQNYRNSPLDPG